MKRLWSVFLILISFYSADLLAANCDKQKWTREDGRTQAGGWIWFPGKGTGESTQIAYLKAEGMAIDRLLKECNFPHKEVKFHERCDEKVGKFYRAFVRASLTHKQCQQTKYASAEFKKKIKNEKLLKTHAQYLKAITKDTAFEEKACTPKKALRCHEMGKYEFQMGNSKKALTYFDRGCRGGNMDSCFNAGITEKINGNTRKAMAFFKLTCQGKKAEDGEGCYFVGLLLLDDSEEARAMTYLERGCASGVSAACFKLGQLYQNKNNQYLSQTYLVKSCRSDYKEGCFEVAKIYYDLGDRNKAKEFSKKGCRMNHEKSCYNLGSLEKEDKLVSRKAFEKACGLGLGLACIKAARLKKKSDSLYLRGCELGESKGCKEMSIRFYDRGKKGKSLEYSKLACKLGEFKSCHNAGMLLYKNGDRNEAKQYLRQSCDSGIDSSCKLIKKYSL
ncbi:MAG: hypothetical protein CME70_16990 [Halobacteriovorax sp.]|nr:hypothetical protein [Halobacteriovorax sp.]|tara:strand:+ start:132296 stop:133636 length:1341 start_codon:yes stop_codon:yes gene_type:complete